MILDSYLFQDADFTSGDITHTKNICRTKVNINALQMKHRNVFISPQAKQRILFTFLWFSEAEVILSW